MTRTREAEVLVVGSGAGGAVTALELARAGHEVLVLEEGGHFDPDRACSAPNRSANETLRQLYRGRGMTTIQGRVPIRHGEACCVGGGCEINNRFWQRAPAESLLRWKSQYDLADAEDADLAEHYHWAETELNVGLFEGDGIDNRLPPSSQAFADGAETMRWMCHEVPRVGAVKTGQGTRSLIAKAEAAGATILSRCRVRRLRRRRGKVAGVVAKITHDDGRCETLRIHAKHVFLCAGATETPSLLLRSGIRNGAGGTLRNGSKGRWPTLRIHPTLKVAAEFPQPMHWHPLDVSLMQVKEFGPDVCLGGAQSSPGHLAMILSENWSDCRDAMQRREHLAAYSVSVRGRGNGSVRPTRFAAGTTLRYELTQDDCRNLSVGLARLSMLLLAAGARAVYPSVRGIPAISTKLDAARWFDELLPRSACSLSTDHAVASCPAGENRCRCAANSVGRIYGYSNLYVNDASMLPDSPCVHPQATIMALARRNALQFAGRSGYAATPLPADRMILSMASARRR